MKISKATGGAFLIAGTCIGAGMLALPVAMAPSGFWPSLLLLIFCWLILFYTGLLVLEANINLPSGANFISMSRATLGKAGEVVTWLTYLLLLYALIAAYLSGGGDLLIYSVKALFNIALPEWAALLLLIIIVAGFICAGAKYVDYFGRFLLIGLVGFYALLVAIAIPHVKLTLLATNHPKHLFVALTIVAAAFGYHVIIPGLRSYLRDNVSQLKRTIFFGSLIPLVVYIIWELLVFGSVSQHSLLQILQSGNTVSSLTKSLAQVADSNLVAIGARFFIIFAIASSFLGIAFSLFDFLADGFAIKKTPKGKILLALITFVPPFIFVELYPRGFILALSYAGIFVAILHGILPALMVWRGRNQGLTAAYQVRGGKLALMLVVLFSLAIIVSQLVAVV